MKLSSILAPLFDQKADHETIRAVILAFEAERADALDRRRESDRERQSKLRKSRESRDSHVSHSDRPLVRDHVAPVEGKSQTTEENTGKKDNTASDLAAFKGALAPLLDSERLEAIIKHRKARKAPVTGHAARLFVGNAERCQISVAEAVDLCVSRNWLTVEPDWIAPRQRAGPASPAKPPTLAQRAGQLAQELENARNLRSSPSSHSLQQAIPDLSVISGGRG